MIALNLINYDFSFQLPLSVTLLLSHLTTFVHQLLRFLPKSKKLWEYEKSSTNNGKKPHMSINHKWIMENHCNKKISSEKYSEKTDILLHIPRISQYAKNILLVFTVIYLHSHLNLFIFRIGQKVPQHTIDIYSN